MFRDVQQKSNVVEGGYHFFKICTFLIFRIFQNISILTKMSFSPRRFQGKTCGKLVILSRKHLVKQDRVTFKSSIKTVKNQGVGLERLETVVKATGFSFGNIFKNRKARSTILKTNG